MLEQQGVQLGPPHHVPVIGHARTLREGQFPDAPAVDPHAVDPVELGNLLGQTHLLQVAHRAGGQPVAAGLIPRELGLVDEHHAGTRAGGLPGRR